MVQINFSNNVFVDKYQIKVKYLINVKKKKKYCNLSTYKYNLKQASFKM